MVFFIGGLEIEIKNPVKMFDPKALKQAYNLARLQDNTLAYRRSLPTPHQYTSQALPNATSFKPNTPLPYSRPSATPNPNTFRSQQTGILPTPTTHFSQKPTRSIRPRDLEERRAKGLCFWCDERFTPGHRCKNKRLYSLCIVEDDEDSLDREGEINVVEQESLIPHISLNALDETRGCHTLRVSGKADQHSVYILIDSRSTHNFLNSAIANKLQCLATPIRTLVVETANGGTMYCSAMCRNFRWRMQGVNFETDVFIVDLINCDMVLGIQWLATLGNIVSNYKDLWMSFIWHGQDVLLRGTD